MVSTRLVSLAQRSVAAIEYTVEALDEFVRVTVQSELVANEDQPETSHGSAGVGRARTARSRPCSTNTPSSGALLVHRTQVQRADDGRRHGPRRRGPGTGRGHRPKPARTGPAPPSSAGCGRVSRLRIVKYLAYGWSSLRSRPALRDQAAAALSGARYTGWEGLLEAQRKYLDEFWDCADVEVEGDPDSQQAVRFGLFHVLQASARAERRAIAGKGLTGTGYDGHAFWDTEGFVLPVLTYTAPHAAADALRWRASTLDLGQGARRAARPQGRRFPWRTIRGQECSAYWPAGTAAWHVNADIAMAFERYRIVTGDESLEAECGLEVLVETARLWLSLGHHDRHGVWHLDGVTGPDEYTAVVRDNVFTNLMAAHNLRTAAEACVRHPDGADEMGVTTEEMAAWRDAADAAHIPFDEELGVHPQCEGFTTLARVGLHGQHRLSAAAARAVRAAVPGAGDQAGGPGAGHAVAEPRVHTGAEGAQRRLLRAPHHPRLVAVGVHAGGDVRRRRPSGARPRLRLRGGADRPARSAPQHPRRSAHGLARRSVDGAGRRASAACATTRACCRSTRNCPRHLAAAIPAALEGVPAHGGCQPRRTSPTPSATGRMPR